jgi:hypothetical protein
MSERATFRPALVVGIVTAGLLSFAAFVALLGWGGGGESQQGELTGPAPSASATGFAGVVRLSGKFFPVDTVQDEEDVDSYDLLVVALTPRDDPEKVAQLLRRRGGQSTLLILPKWAVVRDPQQPRWVRTRGPWLIDAAERLIGGDNDLVRSQQGPTHAEPFGILTDLYIPLPQSAQLVRGEGLQMLAGIREDGALVAQIGTQPHYILADPDVLSNHGIRRPENARAAVELLGRLLPDEDSGIIFDTGRSLEAPARRNLLRAMFEPPFLAMTLALLVAALLAGLYGVGRFGPARRPVRAIPFGKAALVENSAGLVRLAGREVRLGGAYADLVRDEAARAGAAPPHLQGEALEAYLDRFTKPGEMPFSPLADAVRQARDRPGLVAAARALFAWKKDMIR